MFVTDHSNKESVCQIPHLSDFFTSITRSSKLLREPQIEAVCALVRDKKSNKEIAVT